jgi:hypothetical protein
VWRACVFSKRRRIAVVRGLVPRPVPVLVLLVPVPAWAPVRGLVRGLVLVLVLGLVRVPG